MLYLTTEFHQSQRDGKVKMEKLQEDNHQYLKEYPYIKPEIALDKVFANASKPKLMDKWRSFSKKKEASRFPLTKTQEAKPQCLMDTMGLKLIYSKRGLKRKPSMIDTWTWRKWNGLLEPQKLITWSMSHSRQAGKAF